MAMPTQCGLSKTHRLFSIALGHAAAQCHAKGACVAAQSQLMKLEHMFTGMAWKVDDAVDTLDMIAGLFSPDDDGEEEQEDAEADEDFDMNGEETPEAMKRRLRREKAQAREEEKQKARDKKVVKRAQHALDNGSSKGVKDMERLGVMKQVVALMEEPLCDAAQHYKQDLCNILATTLLEVSLWHSVQRIPFM